MGRVWALIAAGAVCGAVLMGEGGMWVGVAVGFLLAQILALRDRVAALEQALGKQASAAAPAAAGARREQPAPVAHKGESVGAAAEPMAAQDGAAWPGSGWEPLAAPERAATASSRPAASEEARGSAAALEARLRSLLFGGNLVVRVGLVVLFFGVAFLFKFAAEQELIPIELRYLGVAAGALGLLTVGWRQRVRRAGFALLLQGGAVGILYITVFSALRLHSLLPPGAAFALLVALVVLSGALAVLQNARGLAVAGTVGGFLAPVLVSTGAGDHVALFSYYALLNAGVLGVAWFRAWRVLNLVGFLFTFLIGTAWGALNYHPGLFATTEPFLIFFYLAYLALSVLYATRQPPVLRGYVDGTLVFGLPVIGFGLQAGMVREMEFGLALSALGLAAIYLGLAAALWRRAGEGLRLLTEAFLALGVVFGSLAIPFALDGQWTAAAWALEGAALIWIGVRQQRLAARVFGLLLQAGAGLFFTASLDPWRIDPEAVFWNARVLGGICIAMGGLVSAYHLRRPERLRRWERGFEALLLGWGLLWWFGTGGAELERQLATHDLFHGLISFGLLSALPMSELSRRLHWRTLALPLAAAGPLLLLALLGDLFNGHPFARYGLPIWGAVLGAFLFILRRQEQLLPRGVLVVQHQCVLWLAAVLLAAESAWLLGEAGAGEAWRLAAWGVMPVALVLLAARLGGRVGWPLAAWRSAYLEYGPLPLLALAGCGAMLSALGAEGDPWPLSYLPLVNPLELAQLFVLIGVLRWRLVTMPAAPLRAALDPLLGLAAFIVLNGMLGRAVHFYTGVPFAWDELLGTTELQTAFAVTWTLLALALTVAAARLGRRRLWLIGAALLAVVVAKLFLVDLASSNTIARIVSFLGVGALMLAIGFFAPLPPRQEEA